MPLQENEDVGDYAVIAKIGQGSFATVYQATHKTTGRNVAIKSVLRSKLTKKLIENLESEISILKAIRHDHIVGLIECHKTSTHVHLVMEYCSMGDLSQYIKRIRADKSARSPAGGLPERLVRHFLKQLASALKFLRSQNLVHRDIKPQNLLLVSPSNNPTDTDVPVLKVADFGFARFLPNASLADTLCGSPLYMGPEILSYKKYDAKADLWSVGAVLYEMITGRPPFRAQNHLELLKKIQETDDQIQFPDDKPTTFRVASDLKDLIRKLLKKNPADRISFEQLFNHPAVMQEADQVIQIPSAPSASSHSTPRTPRYDTNTAYDPPPFAQPSLQRTTSASRRSTQYNEEQSHMTPRPATSQSDENASPLHSRGRPTRVEFKDSSHHWPNAQDSGTTTKRNSKGDVEEEVLQEYVVLDRRIIETNQFADEISASPRSNMAHRQSMGQVAIPRKGSYERPSHSPSPPLSTPPVVSRERKISTGSAGSALAKALSMASVRLFGTGNSPPNLSRLQRNAVGSPRKFMIMGTSVDPMEDQTMRKIERAACMAHTVAKFADTKFDSLVSSRGNETVLAEEAMVLHIKSLALLESGMSLAKQYWVQVSDEQARTVSVRLNDAVQWMRDRFNECLDRASFEGSKCEQEGGNACVEKLLYDRALEMSRAAAVHELVGEHVAECEQDYQSAIWMLEAILEVREEDEMAIEHDDRRIINKFIESIRHRLSVLRKKMDLTEATYPPKEARLTDRLPPHE